jgi:hypothetical protein
MGKIKNWLAAMACAVLVAGCGGGGNSDVSEPATSAGIWTGTTTSGRAVLIATLGDGTLWAIYSSIGTDLIAGMVQGSTRTINSAGHSTIDSQDLLDFNYEGLGLRAATFDGAINFRHNLNGIVRYVDETVSFVSQYIGSLGADISQIQGSYSAVSTSGGDFVVADFTISSAGAISGGSAGCTFSGLATPRSELDAFDVSLTFSGGTCATTSVSGVALYDGGQLIGMTVNGARTSSFLLVGNKL